MNVKVLPTEACLTGLQAMMAYWERLHPVNSVHIAEVSQTILPADLHAAVSRLLKKFREADVGGRWPSLSPRAAVADHEVTPQFCLLRKSPEHPLEALVTRLLNQPFSDDEPPFRVGLAQSDRTNFLWLAYRHTIADARSIALLFQNLLEELAWQASDELPLRIERASRPLSELFPEEARQSSVIKTITHSLKTLWSLGRCHRRPPSDPTAFQMSFQVHAERLPIDDLKRRAERSNATVGELMIASMLEWFLLQDQSRPGSIWSPNRCVSSMMDLTRRAQPKCPQLFGQYLSPLNVMASNKHATSFESVLKQVKETTRRTDAVAHSLRSLRGLAMNSRLMNRCPRAFANWGQEFQFPLSGTLSNVQLNATLPPSRVPLSVMNYHRGSCATQFSPMMLCLTTFQETCSLTTTRRDAVYSAQEMQELAQHVMGRAFGSVVTTQSQDFTNQYAA